MQILNAMTEQEIKQAAFQFQYKGFTVSIANTFGRYEVLAFTEGRDIPTNSIPEAMAAIDTVLGNTPEQVLDRVYYDALKAAEDSYNCVVGTSICSLETGNLQLMLKAQIEKELIAKLKKEFKKD